MVDDKALPLPQGGGEYATNYPDIRDKTVDLIWGFPSSGRFNSDREDFNFNNGFYGTNGQPNLNLNDSENHFYIEYGLMHELSHARYLLDGYSWSFNSQFGDDEVKVLKKNGEQFLPPHLEGNNNYTTYRCGGGMMGCDSPAERINLYSKQDVSALNSIASKRPVYGNYNSSYDIGRYYFNQPADNKVRVVDQNDLPVQGARVDLYRSVKDPANIYYKKFMDNVIDLSCATNSNGVCSIGKNPFGITATKDRYDFGKDFAFKGVALIKITKGEREFFRWLYLHQVYIKYMEGHTQSANYKIKINSTSSTPTPTPTLPPSNISSCRLDTWTESYANSSGACTSTQYCVVIQPVYQNMTYPVGQSWNFGDGKTGYNNSTSKTYHGYDANSGNKTITLSAKENNGQGPRQTSCLKAIEIYSPSSSTQESSTDLMDDELL